MNVLHVICSMDPVEGGLCQGLRNTVPELEKLGVKNQVICLDDPSAPFFGKDSFSIIALGPNKRPWAYSPRLFPWLIKNLGQFDVVIVHGLWLYHGYAVNKALYKLKNINLDSRENIPMLFVMPHGMLDPYFQKAPGRKLKALRNTAYWKLIEWKLVNSADGLLFTCEKELELARLPFQPYLPKKELNVGLGIISPPPNKKEMKWAFAKNCPALRDHSYLLFLSRIHEKKGVDLLINAYAQIMKKNPYPGLSKIPKLVIAGPGMDSPYGKMILQTVEETEGLEEQIYFTGMLHGDAKWGAFYGCDAFVLPSHQENFGIAVTEALACGKPVLVSNQVNISPEITSEGAGIVELDTDDGCLQMLETWFNLSQIDKEEMSYNANQCFRNKFSIAPNTLKLKEALLEVLMLAGGRKMTEDTRLSEGWED